MRIKIKPEVEKKCRFLAQRTKNEVSAIGKISTTEDEITIDEMVLFPQEVSTASIDLELGNINELILKHHASGGDPSEWCVWFHTHPKGCKNPSNTDRQTFSEDFGNSCHFFMLILPKDGDFFCEMRINKKIGKLTTDFEIGCEVFQDYSEPCIVTKETVEEWEKEFSENVQEMTFVLKPQKKRLVKTLEESKTLNHFDYYGYHDDYEYEYETEDKEDKEEDDSDGWQPLYECEACGNTDVTYREINGMLLCEECAGIQIKEMS